MNSAKHIGIVAISYGASALIYRGICAQAEKVLGPHAHPEITMHSYSLARYLPYIESGDWRKVADIMLSSAAIVAKAGADFAICAANAPHEAFPYLTDRSPIPWLHIGEVVAKKVKGLGYSTVGILGTSYIMEGTVYKNFLSIEGVQLKTPERCDRERLNTLILSEIVHEKCSDGTKQYIQRLAGQLANNGCEAIILACTDFTVSLSANDFSMPVLDSTILLAEAALSEALPGTEAHN